MQSQYKEPWHAKDTILRAIVGEIVFQNLNMGFIISWVSTHILYIKAKMVSVRLSVCLSDDGSVF